MHPGGFDEELLAVGMIGDLDLEEVRLVVAGYPPFPEPVRRFPIVDEDAGPDLE